jgi:hypothetical protein
MYFIVTCMVVGVLTLTSLATEALSERDSHLLDAGGQEYQEQIRRLIGQQVVAERNDLPEEELEKLRKERHDTVRRLYEYIKRFRRTDWLFPIGSDRLRKA